MTQQVLEESVDGGEPAVARGRRASSHGLKMIQEGQYHLGTKIVQAQYGDRPMRVLSCELEEEPERVAVGTDGVLTGAADRAQMGLKVGLDEGQERGGGPGHYSTLPALMYRRRTYHLPVRATQA